MNLNYKLSEQIIANEFQKFFNCIRLANNRTNALK